MLRIRVFNLDEEYEDHEAFSVDIYPKNELDVQIILNAETADEKRITMEDFGHVEISEQK